jgi:hypothetical protein
MRDLGERVDAAAERALDAMACWIDARGAAISKPDHDALKAQAVITLRNAIFEAIKG